MSKYFKVLITVLLIFNSTHSFAFSQNRAFRSWFEEKEAFLQRHHSSSSGAANEPEDIDQTLPPKAVLSVVENQRINLTLADYIRVFGQNSAHDFLWTGIESANPLSRDESYRWDSLDDAGMFDHARRILLIQRLRALGIRNIRLGLSNHKIDLQKPESWKPTSDLISDFYRAGLHISLDLHHFGIEDRFRSLTPDGQTDEEHSFYLNPEWPAYFAKFAGQVVARYGHQISAITLINEPETTVGFNGEMWNGGFPRWSSPATNRWYIERCLQVAKAAVLARTEIEKYKLLGTANHSLVFVHTEAGIVKPYWEDFNLYRRFLVSDLILGADWLMQANFAHFQDSVSAESNSIHSEFSNSSLGWMMTNIATDDLNSLERDSLKRHLLDQLKGLRSLHRELKAKYGMTMRSDTVFALDYYAQNEDRDASLNPLRSEPKFYASEIKSGRRIGIRRLLVDYFNHFKMPMMIGETGTVFYDDGSLWHKQMIFEIGKAARTDIPVVGYTIYPAIDTMGWENALSLSHSQSIVNPSGIFTADLKPRPFIIRLIKELTKQL